jgi:hypothetical protein
LPRQSSSMMCTADQEEVTDELARVGTEEVTTDRDCEIDGQVDCGKMHDLVSKRHRSWRTSERAGSREAVHRAGRSRTILEACRGSEWVQPGLVVAAYVETRSAGKGIGSAARSRLGRGPARHPSASQRKDCGTIAMTQGAGPNAGPPAGPPRFGPWASARQRERAGLGPRGGPSGGTVTDPKRIDDQSVIGPARGHRKATGMIAMTSQSWNVPSPPPSVRRPRRGRESGPVSDLEAALQVAR